MPVNNADESAFDLARSMLDEWGLGSLAPRLFELIREEPDPNVRLLKLRKTEEYKTRFAGNEIRRQKGLRVLTEEEYLAAEERYRTQLSDSRWGLPREFFDSPDDYAKMIAADLGSQELENRLFAVKTVLVDGAMNGVLDYARANYGLGTGDLMAFYLDPDKASPLLQAKASAIGAAAARAGYGHIDRAYAEKLDALGIDAASAASGFAEATAQRGLTEAGGVGDPTVTRDDVTSALFEQNALAKERVERAANTRRARFQGGGAFAEGQTGISGLGSANT
jgi:hypothetical protein